MCVSTHDPELESGSVTSYENPFFVGSRLPTMWAHDTNKNTGVGLKFNSEKLDEQINETFSKMSSVKTCKIFREIVVYDDQIVIDRNPFIDANIRKTQ